MIPAMFSPPGPPSQDSRRARVDAGRGSSSPRHFLSTPNHLAREPLRVPGGTDLDRLLGCPARRHGRRLRPRRQLPGHARRLARALRLGDLRRRLLTLAQAMAASSRTTAARFAWTRTVRQIEVGGGRARAVELDDGDPHSRAGHPRLEPRPEAHVPRARRRGGARGGLRPRVRRWRYDAMSMFCVYLALDAPVRWKAAELGRGRRAVLRRLDLRVARRPRRQRVRLPPRDLPPRSPASSPSIPRSSSRASARRARRPASASRSLPRSSRDGGSRGLGGR